MEVDHGDKSDVVVPPFRLLESASTRVAMAEFMTWYGTEAECQRAQDGCPYGSGVEV